MGARPAATRSRGSLAAPGTRRRRGRDPPSARHRAPAPGPSRRVRLGASGAHTPRPVDGGGPELRTAGRPQPPECGRAVGHGAGGGAKDPSLGALARGPAPPWSCRPPQASAGAGARHAGARPAGHDPDRHARRHRPDSRAGSARGRCQRGRQARPRRSRHVTGCDRRPTGVAWCCRTAGCSRLSHLHPHRLGARTPLRADRPPRRAPPATDAGVGERVPRRLPLARTRPGRRDRRLALPPHAGPAGPGPAARPDSHRGRSHVPAFHARPGQLRPGSRESTLSSVADRLARSRS